VKAAISFHRVSSALGRKAVSVTGQSRLKAQRLLSTRRLASIPEHSLAELRSHKPDSASLSETIRLAQQGDAAAFELIYRLHCGRVYALCLRMLREPVEAEDVAQDVFLQLFRKIHTFRGESAFSSWLHRLTANLVLMRLRRKRPMSTSLEEVKSDDEDSGRRDEMGGPDLHLSGLFDRLNLQVAIDQLPMGFKAMFILHDVHGYEHTEIAKILGCSVGNSKSQLHKARKRLRKLLLRVQYASEQSPQNTDHALGFITSY
jgi:RNA polymerase sigma-70 factor, ECF subfamily